MPRRFYLATLGCPKNEVDSAKLAGRLVSDGYEACGSPADADLVVVNTCAFIEAAREESIETILELAAARRPGARLAVTGCLAERAGAELARELPEIDLVAGFGMDVTAGPSGAAGSPVRLRRRDELPSFDLLELPRPPAEAPWAYVKVAEGCDRSCGFCAIPSFRGRQRSRSAAAILEEVDALGVKEVVLVAQDLASWGRDRTHNGQQTGGDLVGLVDAIAGRVERVRLLYLYPSSLTDRLIDAIVATGVPYFDLSLQHASGPHLRRMRRPGSRARFLERIDRIRRVAPGAAFRSSFILGYPGETESDHDELLGFLGEAELDWAGFFTFSKEEGTHAAGLEAQVAPQLALERLAECAELQDAVTARKRSGLVGTTSTVLVDSPGIARSYREAPEIDGVVSVPGEVAVGSFCDVAFVESLGPDIVGQPLAMGGAASGGAPRAAIGAAR